MSACICMAIYRTLKSWILKFSLLSWRSWWCQSSCRSRSRLDCYTTNWWKFHARRWFYTIAIWSFREPLNWLDLWSFDPLCYLARRNMRYHSDGIPMYMIHYVLYSGMRQIIHFTFFSPLSGISWIAVRVAVISAGNCVLMLGLSTHHSTLQ